MYKMQEDASQENTLVPLQPAILSLPCSMPGAWLCEGENTGEAVRAGCLLCSKDGKGGNLGGCAAFDAEKRGRPEKTGSAESAHKKEVKNASRGCTLLLRNNIEIVPNLNDG